MIIRTIAINDGKMYGRDWKALLFLLTLSLFSIWLFMQALSSHLFASRFSQPFAIALVDEDQTFNTRLISRQLEETEYLKGFVTVHHVTEAEALVMIGRNQIAGAVVIPEGFTASLYSGENWPIQFIGNPAQQERAIQMKNELASAVAYIAAGQSAVKAVWHAARDGGATPEQLDRLMKDSVVTFMSRALVRGEIYREQTLASMPDVKLPEYFTAALGALFAGFFAVRGSRVLAEEKASGVLRRLHAAPVAWWQVGAGKFAALFGVLFVQLVILLGAAVLLFDVYLGSRWLDVGLLLLSSSFALASWGMLLGAFGIFSRGADVLGYVGTFLLAFVGGCIYPLFSLPDGLQLLGEWTFQRGMMEGMLVIFSGQEMSVLPACGRLLCTGSVLFGCAALLLWRSWKVRESNA